MHGAAVCSWLCLGLVTACVYENEGNDQEFGPAGDIVLTPSEIAPETNFWSSTATTDATQTGTGTQGTSTTESSGSTSSTSSTDDGSDAGVETEADGGPGEDEGSESTGDVCVKADWEPSLECPTLAGFSSCSEGAEHVDSSENPTWDSYPPHSGPHYEDGVEWKEHDEPLNPAEWLENLSQGGIVFLYNCPDEEACGENLDKLRAVLRKAERAKDKIVLAPDPDLDPMWPFAAVAWTWQYQTDRVSETTFNCFAEQHVDKVPEEDQD